MLDDVNVPAMKTGMLYDEAIIRVIASTLKKYYKVKPLRLVCDPVCVSTSGHALLVDRAIGSLIEEILPLATLITPNRSEAELILSHKREGVSISSLADMISASRELLTFGSRAVLLKGGHVTTTMTEVHELVGANPAISVYKYGLLGENMNILKVGLDEEDGISQLVVDVLQDSCGSGGEVATSIFIRPRIESTSTHGTGCTLSAAIACGLASGLTSNASLRRAFLETDHGRSSTGGCSQGDCLHPSRNSARFPRRDRSRPIEPHTLCSIEICAPVCLSTSGIPNACEPFCRPRPGDRYPLTRALILSTASVWKEYVEHTFVKELGKGLLDERFFVHFIKYVGFINFTP